MLTILLGDYFMWQANVGECENKKYRGEEGYSIISIYDNEEGEYLDWQLS